MYFEVKEVKNNYKLLLDGPKTGEIQRHNLDRSKPKKMALTWDAAEYATWFSKTYAEGQIAKKIPWHCFMLNKGTYKPGNQRLPAEKLNKILEQEIKKLDITEKPILKMNRSLKKKLEDALWNKKDDARRICLTGLPSWSLALFCSPWYCKDACSKYCCTCCYVFCCFNLIAAEWCNSTIWNCIDDHCIDHRVQEVSKMKKARLLMQYLRSTVIEVESAPVDCILACCTFKMTLNKDYILFSLQCRVLAEIEELVLSSLGTEALNLENGEFDTIAKINKAFVLSSITYRVARDQISNELVHVLNEISGATVGKNKYMKLEKDSKVFEGDFKEEDCHISKFSANWEDSLIKNHRALGGNDGPYVPTFLEPIFVLLQSKLTVVEYSARIKTAQSIEKNLNGKKYKNTPEEERYIFDLFGMRLFVDSGSLFTVFAAASDCAEAILAVPNVCGIATSHKLKTATSYVDFKFIVKIKNPQTGEIGFAEIEIIPATNFISDYLGDGHKHQKGEDETNLPPAAAFAEAVLPMAYVVSAPATVEAMKRD